MTRVSNPAIYLQLLLNIYLLLNVYRKDEDKEKEAGSGPLKKQFASLVVDMLSAIYESASFRWLANREVFTKSKARATRALKWRANTLRRLHDVTHIKNVN